MESSVSTKPSKPKSTDTPKKPPTPRDDAPSFFPDIPVLGLRSRKEVVEALLVMEDPDASRAAQALAEEEDALRDKRGKSKKSGAESRGLGSLFGFGPPKAWEHTAHQIGFIAPAPPGSLAPLPVVHPAVVPADESLKDARINIHLDRLRVKDYPGGGEHLVMVTFRARNQLATDGESVSFSQAYRVRAGETAGVTGYPMCMGLGVGKVGAAFQFLTVNVKDSADEAAVAVLESPAFTGGLNLLTIAQPAIKPLTDLTVGLAKQFATRNRNRPVQDCFLGLDFGSAAFGARLAVGNYIAVQVPSEGAIRWEEWEFQPGNGLLLNKADRQPLPFNYLVFRVSKHEE
jgi:hypothetical protein